MRSQLNQVDQLRVAPQQLNQVGGHLRSFQFHSSFFLGPSLRASPVRTASLRRTAFGGRGAGRA